MQNHNPKISVLLSTHNGQQYIKLAIETVLNQTMGDFEFLIVDDASTDDTPNILRRYRQQDSRIKIITNQQNLGLTKSLNKAISQARGQYIARMDDDDISAPERLEKQRDLLERNPQVALCGSRALVIDENGREIGRKDLAVSHKDIKNKLLFNNQFIHSSLFIRKSVLDREGLYNEAFLRAQDYELVLRIASKYEVANLPEYLLKWRAWQSSLSFSGSLQQRCAIKARWWAITKYGYPKLEGLYHILLRTVWLCIPRWAKGKRKISNYQFPISK